MLDYFSGGRTRLPRSPPTQFSHGRVSKKQILKTMAGAHPRQMSFFDNFLTLHVRALKRFARRAGKAGESVGEPEMAAAVYRSVSAWYSEGVTTAEVNAYIDRLNAPDLAVVTQWQIALAANNQPACLEFESRARSIIEEAALTLTSDFGKMLELVNLAIAHLRGSERLTGGRKSILEDFQGRSSLKNWLRAFTAKLYFDSTPHDFGLADSKEFSDSKPVETGQPKLERSKELLIVHTAFDEVLAPLQPRDRLRMALRYLHRLSNARIARVMREPEDMQRAEVARARSQLREALEARLKHEFELNEAQIRDCYDQVSLEWRRVSGALPTFRGKS